MKNRMNLISLFLIMACLVGCSTSAKFKIPAGSELYINRRPEKVVVSVDGTVRTRPFFWTSIAGIPYELKNNGKTIKEGKLRSKFRVVSIFWPPYAILYWPAGFNPTITYDLQNDKQE